MYNVLIVDDRAEDRYIFKNFFNLFGMASGINIFEASSAKEAIEKMYERRFDLVLMDIRMETENAGLNALSAIRNDENMDGVPIWLVTSYDIDSLRKTNSGVDLRNEYIITRPFDQVEVLQKVSALLNIDIPEKTKMKMGL